MDSDSDASAMVSVPRWALEFIMENAEFLDRGPDREGFRAFKMQYAAWAMKDGLDGVKPSVPHSRD